MSAMAMESPYREPSGAHGPFEAGLERTPANHRPLSPVSFLRLAARVCPDRPAQIEGKRQITWGQTLQRCQSLATALQARGIGRDHTVSVLSSNSPALFEAHFAIPMAGAVLNAIEPVLDAASLAFILDHAETRLLLVSSDALPLARTALAISANKPPVVVINTNADPEYNCGYEALITEGSVAGQAKAVDNGLVDNGLFDEWRAITLSYTPGTTGAPKGVVAHHRGACLSALGLALAFGTGIRSSGHVIAMPMARANGWGLPWAVAAMAVPLIHLTRPGIRGLADLMGADLLAENRITHLALSFDQLPELLASGLTAADPRHPLQLLIAGGVVEPTAVATLAGRGFTVMDGYGASEIGGLPLHSGAGWSVSPILDELAVVDPVTGVEVAADGRSQGEVRLRGNSVMKGYFKNPVATRAALADGWLRTGDAAVRHVDGRVEIKARLTPLPPASLAGGWPPHGPAL